LDGDMKKIVLFLALTAAASGAQAQQRPFTPSLSCGQAQQIVAANGAVVLGTGPHLYDRYVRDHRYCQFNEVVRPAWVPARDTPQCFVGYLCRESDLELFSD